MAAERRKTEESANSETSFESILQVDVPMSREGKHKRIVTRLLADIENLKPGTALKVPLAALPDTKENVRSALNRATRLKGIRVETSSDEENLYIWKATSAK